MNPDPGLDDIFEINPFPWTKPSIGLAERKSSAQFHAQPHPYQESFRPSLGVCVREELFVLLLFLLFINPVA